MATKTGDAETKTGQAEGTKGRKKLLLIAGPVVLLIIAAVGYFLFLKPSGSEPEKVEHTPGAIVTLDPITINLAGGHFLKLGMALQTDAKASSGHEEVGGAQALDLAIELFSGKTVTELSAKEGREKAKESLVEHVTERYENEVYDVYFTEFVYQ
jgi:flagellar FliL protein